MGLSIGIIILGLLAFSISQHFLEKFLKDSFLWTLQEAFLKKFGSHRKKPLPGLLYHPNDKKIVLFWPLPGTLLMAIWVITRGFSQLMAGVIFSQNWHAFCIGILLCMGVGLGLILYTSARAQKQACEEFEEAYGDEGALIAAELGYSSPD
jgi:hypothetical protein